MIPNFMSPPEGAQQKKNPREPAKVCCGYAGGRRLRGRSFRQGHSLCRTEGASRAVRAALCGCAGRLRPGWRRTPVSMNVAQERSQGPQHHKWMAACCVWIEIPMRSLKWSGPLLYASPILHDVVWEGKVACNCLDLGWLGWPSFEGVWKGCVWGSSWGIWSESSAQCARSASSPFGHRVPA